MDKLYAHRGLVYIRIDIFPLDNGLTFGQVVVSSINGALWMSWQNVDCASEEEPLKTNKCYMRMLGKSYKEHTTNEYVWQQVNLIAGRQQRLLSTVKRSKLSWFDHVCRRDTLPKSIQKEQ